MVELASDGASQPRVEDPDSDVERLRIRHWRAKAEEMRTIADGMKNDLARRGFLNAAANYDRLADEYEERDKDVSRHEAG
jgi:hypothetical protein